MVVVLDTAVIDMDIMTILTGIMATVITAMPRLGAIPVEAILARAMAVVVMLVVATLAVAIAAGAILAEGIVEVVTVVEAMAVVAIVDDDSGKAKKSCDET